MQISSADPDCLESDWNW